MQAEPFADERARRHHAKSAVARVVERRHRQCLSHAMTAATGRHVGVLNVDELRADAEVRQLGLLAIALQANGEASSLLVVFDVHSSLRGIGQSTAYMGDSRPSAVINSIVV